MNAEQLAREITGDLFASASDKEGVLLCLIVNGRQIGGYCRDSVERIIAAKIKPLIEDAEKWRELQSPLERAAMAENSKLRRQLAFVKSGNHADTSDDGSGFCMLCFCDHSQNQPHHPDCPNKEDA